MPSMALLLALLTEMPALAYTTEADMRLPEAERIVMLDVPALRAPRRAGIMQRRGSFVTPAA